MARYRASNDVNVSVVYPKMPYEFFHYGFQSGVSDGAFLNGAAPSVAPFASALRSYITV